jgi:Zn-finger nucleic acid-binding protein
MQPQQLERHDGGTVRVDLCFGCAGIWFDHLASVQLAPGAVILLFKEIYEHKSDARKPRESTLQCPRCDGALVQSFDLGKTGRFSYFRCAAGDGRFTPFFQFLREKQFIRTLNAAELQRVRAEVRQITCSECGAPIDLEHSTECKYCHAPVAFLDAEAVEKAIKLWSTADERRHLAPSPEALGNAMLALQLHHEDKPAGLAGGLSERFFAPGVGSSASGARLGIDLVAAGIHAIGHLFDEP